MLKENDVFEKGIFSLRECLSIIPAVNIESIERLEGNAKPDFSVRVHGAQFDQLIYVEAKSLGTPKNTRIAVNSLLQYLKNDLSAYGIFIAPYISPKSASICRDAGIGYLDLSGNCRIVFQQVFISRENFPNKYLFKTSLSSLYSPKSERILRVLLTFPYRSWRTIELANEAQVSPGMITHVRKKLEDEEWGETTSKGLRLRAPEESLRNWVEYYSLQRSSPFEFYSVKPLSEIEKEIAQACDELNIPYAFTGFSASNHLAPMVRSQRLMAYIDRGIDLLADRLGLQSVNSGANVSLFKPYDDGVFWGAKEIDNITISTPIQVYLDLKSIRGRGEEAADFLFKEVIQKSWQQQKMNTTAP